ncbi:DUF3883 domain-containing protein [Neobacillus sp. NPDC093182]|uniref:DUF3883 domain-containing protein n=1 Tax=Neobacillus sp. NPDC093182 TaxID=3364297 RepID=UPI003804741A
MFKELTKYNSFGKREDFLFLFGELLSSNSQKLDNIIKYCLSRTNYQALPVRAITKLLYTLSLVDIDSSENIYLTYDGLDIKKSIQTDSSLREFTILVVQKILIEIIDINNFSFDAVIGSFTIKNNNIPFQFSGIRNLLLKLDFFYYGTNSNLLVVNNDFLKDLEKLIKVRRKTISYEEFKRIQEHKEAIGQMAEDFVIDFERKRLKCLGRGDLEKIMKVSDIDVGAGYDIISFLSCNSEAYDKFIEVKSYDGIPSFFWSINEVRVSEKKNENYFLYLVDRTKIESENYEPLIICNPYTNVFNSLETWTKEPQTWYFKLKP